MAIVLEFPHTRAFTGSRAANSAKNSAVTPASLALSAHNRAAQKSAGILSLCAHLRTAKTEAPTSDAKASGEFQRATTSRKLETMSDSLGQFVLKRNPVLSQDPKNVLGHNVPMDKYAKRAWAAGIITRTREARAMTRLGQIAMGNELGMYQGKYKQYETRTPMPAIYHEKFCEICGCNIEWFRDGHGPKTNSAKRPRKNILS